MEVGGTFVHQNESPVLTEAEIQIIADFTRLYFRHWSHDKMGGRGSLSIGWLGYMTQKCPTDLWTIQEIIVETQPDFIVECGTCLGGSGLFFAMVCDLLGRGQVVSIDSVDRQGRPIHARLDYVTGSSSDAGVFAAVAARIPPLSRVMVILDSDHSASHVAAELDLWADLVTPGCYLVVEDTAVNGHPIAPDFGPGPMEALDAFLSRRTDFKIDNSRERFLLTMNPRGYLRRMGCDGAAELKLRDLRHALTDFEGIGLQDGTRFFGPPPDSLEERQALRNQGKDWPLHALTMIGLVRLEQFQTAISTVIAQKIPGDIIETGVWRGGACILARAVLRALNVADRNIWVADSFAGLPPPRPDLYAADDGDTHYQEEFLKVSRAEVEGNFAKYGLLDDQVRFLEGWFAHTLPAAPMEKLAVLRLDGDMYESTWVALENLYDKVSPGGFVIIDDYGAIPACRLAVDRFRKLRGITAPLEIIDWSGRFWRVALTDNLDIWRGYANAEAEHLTALAQSELAQGKLLAAKDRALQALALDGNALPAHLVLAKIALPGPDYLVHLARLHAVKQPQTYVEIGVFKGESLALASQDCRVIGIDPQPRYNGGSVENLILVQNTSDQFFEEGKAEGLLAGSGFDLAFIDGSHAFAQGLRDFIHLEQYAAPDAMIVLHDTLPLDEVTSGPNRMTTFYSGDVWKLLWTLRDLRPDLRIRTIAASPTGLTLIDRLDPHSTLLAERYAETIAHYGALEWADDQGRRNQFCPLPSFPHTIDRLLDGDGTCGAEFHETFTNVVQWRDWLDQHPEITDAAWINYWAQAALIAAGSKTEFHPGGNWREELRIGGFISRQRAVLELARNGTNGGGRVFSVGFDACIEAFPEARCSPNIDAPYASVDTLILTEYLHLQIDLDAVLISAQNVLAPGGCLLATFPFAYDSQADLVGACVIDGSVTTLPENPAQGMAVLPGWNILRRCQRAGLSDAQMVFVSSSSRAILGAEIAGIFVLRAWRKEQP